MTEIKTAFAAMLDLLAKLSKFNAFAGGFVGFCYGMLASVLDREFLGLGSRRWCNKMSSIPAAPDFLTV